MKSFELIIEFKLIQLCVLILSLYYSEYNRNHHLLVFALIEYISFVLLSEDKSLLIQLNWLVRNFFKSI